MSCAARVVVALLAAQMFVGVARAEVPAREESANPQGPLPTVQGIDLQAPGALSTPMGRTVGLGVQLGYPTALTAKLMLQPDQGLAIGIGGLSGFVYDRGSFALNVDYVWHPHLLTQSDVFALTWFVGGGGGLAIFAGGRPRPWFPALTYFYFPTQLWLAARAPVGVSIALKKQPVEVFFQLDPQLLLFPSLTFGVGGAIGARFYVL